MRGEVHCVYRRPQGMITLSTPINECEVREVFAQRWMGQGTVPGSECPTAICRLSTIKVICSTPLRLSHPYCMFKLDRWRAPTGSPSRFRRLVALDGSRGLVRMLLSVPGRKTRTRRAGSS